MVRSNLASLFLTIAAIFSVDGHDSLQVVSLVRLGVNLVVCLSVCQAFVKFN